MKYDLTQEKIIRYVQSGKLFGILLCDIETPGELKAKFDEFAQFSKTKWFRERISASTCVSTLSKATSLTNPARC